MRRASGRLRAALERSTGTGLLKRGYIESWNLVVERKLPANFLVSVGYVGTQTVHQFADRNVMRKRLGIGGPDGRSKPSAIGRS